MSLAVYLHAYFRLDRFDLQYVCLASLSLSFLSERHNEPRSSMVILYSIPFLRPHHYISDRSQSNLETETQPSQRTFPFEQICDRLRLHTHHLLPPQRTLKSWRE